MKRTGFALMAIPGALFLFIFHTIPALMGAFYSFTDYRGYGSWNFVGVDNYVRLFQDPLVRHSYIFTIGFALLTAILTNVISVLLAVMMTQNIRFRSFIRGVFFLPAVLATVVIGYVFDFIFSQVVTSVGKGIGNSFLSKSLLGNAKWAWVAIVIVAVWQACAVTTVIYMTFYRGEYDPSIEKPAPSIRPDCRADQWRPWYLDPIDFLFDLQERFPRRTVRIPVGECRRVFPADHSHFPVPAQGIQLEGEVR